MRRYLVFGFAVVLALALTVPALGGPSNPVASSAVSLGKVFKVAKKARNKANAAQEGANVALARAATSGQIGFNAQVGVGQALEAAAAAQQSADNAQASADAANAEAGQVSANDLSWGIGTTTTVGPNSTNNKTVIAPCPSGEVAIGGFSFISTPANTDPVVYDGDFWYGTEIGLAREFAATAASWSLTGQASCIRQSG